MFDLPYINDSMRVWSLLEDMHDQSFYVATETVFSDSLFCGIKIQSVETLL